MKKLTGYKIFLLTVVLIFLTMGQIAAAADVDTLFKDEFNEAAKEWTATSGKWEVVSGEYTQSDNTKGAAAETYTGDFDWTDYTYEADVKVTDGYDADMLFRVNMDTEYYALAIRSNSFEGENHLELLKLQEWNWSVLAGAKRSIEDKTFHHVKVVTKGNNLKVYFNNEETPVIDFTDDKPITSGKIGLKTWESTAAFDNVIVSKMSESKEAPVATDNTGGETPVKSDDSKIVVNPKTGDGGISLYVVLMALSSVLIIFAIRGKRKSGAN